MAASAQGQSLNSADLCAAIELARTPNSVTRIGAPLAGASDAAAREEKVARDRLAQVRAMRDQEQQRVAQIDAEIAGKKFGAPSLADLDQAVEAAKQRRATRASALRAVLDARRTLAGREQQQQSDPASIAQSSIDEARRNLAALERALEGELPLNQIDAEIAAAEAAAAARRAEIAELEQRRTAARAVVAERAARVAERESELATASAHLNQLRGEVAIVRACMSSRFAQLAQPRDPPPPPVVAAPPVYQQPYQAPGYVAPPEPVYQQGPPPGYVPASPYPPQPVYDAPPPAVVDYGAPGVVVPPVTINIPIGSRPPRHRYDEPAFHRPQHESGPPPNRMSGPSHQPQQGSDRPPQHQPQQHQQRPPTAQPAAMPQHAKPPGPSMGQPGSTPQRTSSPPPQRLSSPPPTPGRTSSPPPSRMPPPSRKGELPADSGTAQ